MYVIFAQLDDIMNIDLLIFAIALCTPLMRGQLLSSPMNTIAKIGQRVELECSTNATLPLNWDFAEVNSTRFEHIHRNEVTESKFSSRYYVYDISSSVKRHWVLVINSVDIYHAGTYRCLNVYEPKFIQMNASAQLAVIDSDPVCGTNASNGAVVEGDYIQMWCTANYSGNWILVMEWTINGQIPDRPTRNTNGPRRVTSSLTKQLASNDSGITFTCKMSLNPNSSNNLHVPAQVDKAMATNIPYYQHSWNYAANVLYGPRNQTIILIYASLKTEIRLECFADGNPVPSYEWGIVGKTIPLSNGSIVVISKSMITDEEQTLRCTAWNYVAGQIRRIEATHTFPLTQTPTSRNSCLIMLTASGVLAVIGLCSLGIGVALTVKACAKGNSVNRESCKESSVQHQDYEMVDESNMKPGSLGKPPSDQITSKEGGIEHCSTETTASEDYSSLNRRSSATSPCPAVYAELQQYANTGRNND